MTSQLKECKIFAGSNAGIQFRWTFFDRKRFKECQFQPVISSFDNLSIFPYCSNLELGSIHFFTLHFKETNYLFPMRTILEVFIDSALFVCPTMFLGAIEQGRFGLSDVWFTASRAGVLVNQTWTTQEWSTIFIWWEKLQLCCLELDLEEDFLILSEQFEEALLRTVDDILCFFSKVL